MVTMNRRQFLINTATTVLATGLAVYPVANDQPMIDPVVPEGKILLDGHTHLSKRYLDNPERMLRRMSGSVTAMTISSNRGTISYNDFLKLGKKGVKIEEIDSGLLAKFSYKGIEGYVMHNVEVNSDFHLLTLGIKKIIPNHHDVWDSIHDAKDLGAYTILAHPYVRIEIPHPLNTRMINKQEEEKLFELCPEVDHVETFNGYAINLIFSGWNFNKANGLAKALAKQFNFTGFASTDTHKNLELILLSGILIDKANLSMKSIIQSLEQGKYSCLEQYPSRFAWAKSLI
jgi:hypothetical protein